MRNLLPFSAALCALAIAAAGCGDGVGPDENVSEALSAEEAADVAAAVDEISTSVVDAELSGLSLSSAAPVGSADVSFALEPITRTDEFTVTRSCPHGGSTTLGGGRTGIIDREAETVSVDVSATMVHEECGVRTRKGIGLTLSGSVDLVAHREATRHLGASGYQTHEGSIDYVTDEGREGTCTIDFRTEFMVEAGSATRTITGTVCNRKVDATHTWTRNDG